ncbi:MAG: pilus assembly protein N-terminal domain-containing protein [Bryobacterales bacterium]|nr:pilus assembly protein N-terminal domain-containing protein [Bryobacterales bacterium]
MRDLRVVTGVLFAMALAASWRNAAAQAPAGAAEQQPATEARELSVTAGKSVILDSPVNILRVAVANGELAEAIAATPREIVVNGKTPGETTLIIWQQGGNRLLFDLTVLPNTTRQEAVRQQLAKELAGQDISFNVEGETVFLRGTAKDLVSAERAERIAGTLGKTLNLLHVVVPPAETQILLKVRFANVDRAASTELGANFISTGALNTEGRLTTGAFSPPTVRAVGSDQKFTLTDALNIFLFRPDLNLAATIRALQSKRLLEILAEPNVLAINGRPASFLAGGEFPYPTLQGGGGGLGAVTIQFREFGVRINFLPKTTPRGTIRLQVTPEVSSLDYANGLVFQGFTIPGLNTRRVQTEIELENGQSFAIAGLLDNRVTENLSKIPGLGDIPLLGKLFRSRTLLKNNSELLVLVTPELVRPIPAEQAVPEMKMPVRFLEGAPQTAPRTPGVEVTGPVPVKPVRETMPVEQLIESQKPAAAPVAPAQAPQVQFAPVPVSPTPAQPAPAAPPGGER